MMPVIDPLAGSVAACEFAFNAAPPSGTVPALGVEVVLLLHAATMTATNAQTTKSGRFDMLLLAKRGSGR